MRMLSLIMVCAFGCGSLPEARMIVFDGSEACPEDPEADVSEAEPAAENDAWEAEPSERFECVCLEVWSDAVIWEYAICVPAGTLPDDFEPWIAPARAECAAVHPDDGCRCDHDYCEPAGECISQ